MAQNNSARSVNSFPRILFMSQHYFGVQKCSKISNMMFRYDHLGLRLFRLIIFVLLTNRIRNLKIFNLYVKLVFRKLGFYNSSPLKRKFRPRN